MSILTMPLRRWLKMHPIAGFLLLAFGCSHLFGTALILTALGWGGGTLAAAKVFLGQLLVASGPALAAIVMAWSEGEGGGVRALLSRLLPRNNDVVWTIGLCVVMVASALLVLEVVAVGPIMERASWWDLSSFVPTLGLQLLLTAVGLELGWRGWLLPALLQRANRLYAALLVALVSALWYIPGLMADAARGFMLMLGTGGLSMIFTWVWVRTDGRLFAIVLAYAVANAPLLLLHRLLAVEGERLDWLHDAWLMLHAAHVMLGAILMAITWRWWMQPEHGVRSADAAEDAEGADEGGERTE